MRYFFITTLLFLPSLVLAQGATYTPLVNIPALGGGNVSTFDDYINALYGLSISVAALLAVIKIIIAGVKWMMTDVVTSKGDAKKDIQGALVGLLVVLAAVLILYVINPQIGDVQLNLTNPGLVTGTPTPPTNPTTISLSTVCSQLTCTSSSSTYINQTIASIARGNNTALNNFNNACLNSNGVTYNVVDPTNQAMWIATCNQLTPSENTRITNLFTAANPTNSPSIIAQRVQDYTRYIAPFLDPTLSNGKIFGISGNYNIGYAIQYCQDLGGTPNRNIITGSLSSTFVCS